MNKRSSHVRSSPLLRVIRLGRLVLGVDEAGRGPVIGPMVVAGVMLDENRISELTELGVKDSKLLTASKRRMLAPEIEHLAAKYALITLPPSRVDDSVMRRGRLWKLNFLEAQTMAEIIEATRPHVAYVDSCDVNPARFAETIRYCLPIELREVGIVSEHKADRKYPIVAAASILAKVRRDEQIEELRMKFGIQGSGYAHDARTLGFLSKWYENNSRFPDFVRKSWKTTIRIRDEFSQTHLPEFSAISRKRSRGRALGEEGG